MHHRSLKAGRALTGALLLLGASWVAAPAALGWGAEEHAEMGHRAYRTACARLLAEGYPALLSLTEQATDETPGASSAGLQSRLNIACPPKVELRGTVAPPGDTEDLTARRAQAYGQATAIGGDHLAAPEDFFDRSHGTQVASAMVYAGLGLRNHAHFHPVAPRTWRKVRTVALDEATAAARLTGSSQVQLFEQALLRHAFADHFLQDSFASGHMGFNRSGSSTVAALLFHDDFNRRGRVVIDSRGQRWKTYGDGEWTGRCADEPPCQDRVIDAAAMSLHGFLRAFVTGHRDGALEIEAEAAVPRVIESPRVIRSTFGRRVYGATADGDMMGPAAAIGRPAYRSRELSLLWLRRSLAGPDDALGLEYQNTAMPGFSDLRWGLAFAVHLPGARVFDFGLRPISLHLHPFTMLGGTISNELEALGYDIVVRTGAARDAFDGPTLILYPVGWRLNLEMGATVVRVSMRLAIAWEDPAGAGGFQRHLGWQLGLGIGYATTASGGGLWERFHLR